MNVGQQDCCTWSAVSCNSYFAGHPSLYPFLPVCLPSEYPPMIAHPTQYSSFPPVAAMPLSTSTSGVISTGGWYPSPNTQQFFFTMANSGSGWSSVPEDGFTSAKQQGPHLTSILSPPENDPWFGRQNVGPGRDVSSLEVAHNRSNPTTPAADKAEQDFISVAGVMEKFGQAAAGPSAAVPFFRSVDNPLRKLSFDLIKTYKLINEVSDCIFDEISTLVLVFDVRRNNLLNIKQSYLPGTL